VRHSLYHLCAGVLMVTMVIRDLVPGTRVGRACALAARGVATSTVTPAAWTRGPIRWSVTAASATQVMTPLSKRYSYWLEFTMMFVSRERTIGNNRDGQIMSYCWMMSDWVSSFLTAHQHN